MTHNVRGHTRTTASGKTTRVNQHSRTGGGAKPNAKPKKKRGPNHRHAWKLAKKAYGHGRVGRKGKAAMFGVAALLELVGWFTLTGTAAVCAIIGGILVGLSVVLVK